MKKLRGPGLGAHYLSRYQFEMRQRLPGAINRDVAALLDASYHKVHEEYHRSNATGQIVIAALTRMKFSR